MKFPNGEVCKLELMRHIIRQFEKSDENIYAKEEKWKPRK